MTDLLLFADEIDRFPSAGFDLAGLGLPPGPGSRLEKLQALKASLEAEERATRADPRGPAAPPVAYRLKITLKYLKPPVWRRVLVRSDSSLGELHQVVQRVMPWSGGHLHAFRIGEVSYGPTRNPLDEPLEWGNDDEDEDEARLQDVLGREGARGLYEYDFGDSWRHEILVEKVLELDPNLAYPACVGGKRACPPEDVGGAWGYADTLEILNDPEHPEREERLEWLGGPIDPEAFSVGEANEALAGLRGTGRAGRGKGGRRRKSATG